MISIPKNYRVLIVDDDSVSLLLLADHLRAAGHETMVARDAAEAKELLSCQTAQIVVADWVMPGTSGVDLCRWVRQRENCRGIHFVILTMYAQKEKLVEAFDAGVDDFLSKPIEPTELIARLGSWKRMIQLRADLEAQYRAVAKLNQDLIAANEKLYELAAIDELTGLPNRRQAVKRLQEHLARRRRYGEVLCCAMIDIDQFKSLNDTNGHAVGDLILRRTAELLRQSVREVDEVFRVGGDEFLIIFPRQHIDDAARIGERCRLAIESSRVTRRGADIGWSVSIGVAEPSDPSTGALDFLEGADQALYRAKARGRNFVDAQMTPNAALPPGIWHAGG
jgi:diguanylate cyclase (GGDEF)-like protein